MDMQPTLTVVAPAPGPQTPFRPMKTDWLQAFRSVRRLMADQEDTAQVFEIMRALNGRSTWRSYNRLLGTREGGRLAYERLEFGDRLMNDAWLNAMPAGSVGAAYRDFVRGERLSAESLAQVSREGMSAIEDPHPYAWLARRTRDVHDIWHVLTGYGRDGLGEVALVAFSYAQTRGLGWAAIAVAMSFRAWRAGGHPQVKAIVEGYRLGKAAAWLLAEDYERLMAEPVESARRRLNIAPPAAYEAVPPTQRNAAWGR